jgi:hypothetical protein
VTDAAVHSAYRRLSKSTHPDRNGGSAEATRRFMEVQAAYEQVLAQRRQTRPPSTPRPQAGDPAVEARLADLERQVREARAARDRAAQAARNAVREVQGEEEIHLPADDEDSFSKLLADAAAELHDRVAGSREHPTVKRAARCSPGWTGWRPPWTASAPENGAIPAVARRAATPPRHLTEAGQPQLGLRSVQRAERHRSAPWIDDERLVTGAVVMTSIRPALRRDATGGLDRLDDEGGRRFGLRHHRRVRRSDRRGARVRPLGA